MRLFNRFQYAFNYLIYFFSAGTAHAVHSPFVYQLVQQVIRVRKQKPYYHLIELIRSKMLKSKAMIAMQGLGAAAQSGQKPLSEIVRNSSKSSKYAELLERMCAYFQPEYVIEIGSAAGISTMYQALALPNGQIHALEGNAGLVKVMKHNFEQMGLQNIVVHEGLFSQTLPVVLNELPRVDYVFFDGDHSLQSTLAYFESCLQKAHTGSIFVFDDIRWSDDMHLAWQKIKQHPAVTVSIDLYAIGIVFFRTEQETEHFTIRY
ncbi:MAG: hypothetical protein RLZZ60_417 [Bacteroidota bacterium]